MAKGRKATAGRASRPRESGAKLPKHQVVFEYLHSSILAGGFKPGDRLPSEAELGVQFDASRITVAKAVLELQRMGLVTRRPGSGTHVLARQQPSGYTFGLLIPELGLTEIFEPICRGMMRSPFARPDALLWGNPSASSDALQGHARSGAEALEEAEHMARYFIDQKVSGVFFAPVELVEDKDPVNHRVMRALDRAKIPTVMLDRCVMPYPERSGHDLVGIDNARTCFMATEHLIRLGATRFVFLAERYAAPTVDARAAGFLEALRKHGIRPDDDPIWRGSPQDGTFVQEMLDRARPNAIVCANDVTALPKGISIPEEVRIVGTDDVRYASLLPVPLTTMHQNCAELGVIAMATMLQRLEHPELPTRDILLPTRLVVRRSCGAHLGASS
jgi:GntR family transcriptional regulator of arabinose operon